MKYSITTTLSFFFFTVLLCFTSCTMECDDSDGTVASNDNDDKCVVEPIDDFVGEWEGTFDQYNFTEYPMIMDIQETIDCEFFGELRWPTLDNSITTMEGYFRNDSLFFTETQLLQGSNIVLNGAYIATYERNTISGIWNYPNNGAEGGNFSITKN